MRKHVKPADPNASIPDPERRTDLPPEGRVVTWSTHWARLAAREDVVVTDLPEVAEPEVARDGEAAEPQPDPEAAPHPDA